MSKHLRCWLLAALIGLIIAPSAGSSQNHKHRDPDPNHGQQKLDTDGQPGSVTGWIRDAACLFRNSAASSPSTPETLDCAQECVKGGSPLIVLTAEGNLYFVISGAIPDVSQQQRLYPYIGKYVRASGRLFERAGAHGIAIETLQVVEAPGK